MAAMLMDQDAILRAMEHRGRHDVLSRGPSPASSARCSSIAERGDVVDPLTLADELSRQGELEGAGGKDYIGFLLDAVPTRGERRVPRAHREGEGAPAAPHRGVAPRSSAKRTTARRRPPSCSTSPSTEDLSGRASSAARRASRASRNCCGRRWSASRRSSAAADDHRRADAASTISTRSRSGFQPSDLDHRRGASVDGQDGVRAEHRAIRRRREEYSGGGLLAGNE